MTLIILKKNIYLTQLMFVFEILKILSKNILNRFFLYSLNKELIKLNILFSIN